jgi:hypothetical protein
MGGWGTGVMDNSSTEIADSLAFPSETRVSKVSKKEMNATFRSLSGPFFQAEFHPYCK